MSQELKESPIITMDEINDINKSITELGQRCNKLRIPFLFQATVVAELPPEIQSGITLPNGKPADESTRTLATRQMTNLDEFPQIHTDAFVQEFHTYLDKAIAARNLPHAPNTVVSGERPGTA